MNAVTMFPTNNIIFVEQVRIDYKELRSTFSDYEEQVDHVMVGIMYSINDRIIAIKKYHAIEDWNRLNSTVQFMQSVVKYIATPSLNNVLSELKILVEKEENTSELKSMVIMADQLLFNTSNSIKNHLNARKVVMV